MSNTPRELARHGQSVQVTISAGLANFPEDGEDAAKLVATADEWMYQALKEQDGIG